jgi:diguanylate cyclase (GGDEF)-like protein
MPSEPDRTMNVLIVDDDDSLRHVVHDLLLEIGCDSVRFTSCEEAALRARDRSPEYDLILLDLAPQQLVRVRHSLAARFPRIPIAAVSEGDYESVAETALAALRAVRRHHTKREQKLTARVRRLERSNDELMRIACKDPLTGLANRRHFDELLSTEWLRAVRDQAPLSFVMLDLDYFHALNERYGHLGGDRCLKRVARAMARCLRRPSDILARYGGEEFAALLPSTDVIGACSVAERLRARVEQLQIPHKGSRCSSIVTLSAGVATITPTPGGSRDLLVAAADVALFRAKRKGRNRICPDPLSLSLPVVCHPLLRASNLVMKTRKLHHDSSHS